MYRLCHHASIINAICAGGCDVNGGSGITLGKHSLLFSLRSICACSLHRECVSTDCCIIIKRARCLDVCFYQCSQYGRMRRAHVQFLITNALYNSLPFTAFVYSRYIECVRLTRFCMTTTSLSGFLPSHTVYRQKIPEVYCVVFTPCKHCVSFL